MLKIGLIGAGFMGSMHTNVYANIPEAQLVAMADLDEAKAAKLAPEARIYGRAEEMFATESLDVVDVCLPTYLHAEYVVKAAEAGMHVLCEKPMAMNTGEADRMIAATEKAGMTFMIAQCIRFWPEYMALKRIVDEGSLGKLTSLSCVRRSPTPTWSWNGWLLDPARSGGATLDLHVHDTDYILHLFGKPGSVFSSGVWDERGCVHIFTTYDFGPERSVFAEAGWDFEASFPFSMSFSAVFERGVVAMQPQLVVYETGKDPVTPELPKPDIGSVEGLGNISDLGGYYNEIRYFVDCLLKGEKPQIVTPGDAKDSVETVLAEMESAKTGKVVSLA
ncbi:MAG: Gfo/Idh/MocA family oxidoreductase [Candidatus Latescibacterota bacterium]